MRKKKILKIFFSKPLQKTDSGYSLGETTFFNDMIENVDIENNAVVLKQGWQIALSKDATLINSGNHRLRVGDIMINKIELNFIEIE